MNGFGKQYEYTEEKRGLILLFIIMLFSIDSFLAISYTVQVHGFLKRIPVLATGVWVIGILFGLFILYTAITCYKLKRNMVAISKAYLIVRAIFMTICIIIIYLNLVNDKSMIANGARQYKNLAELNFMVLIMPIAYHLVFSGGWYLYFLKSQRCKEIGKNSS